MFEAALSEEGRKVAATAAGKAAGKAAGTVAGALIKNRLFTWGAKKELVGVFVSALAVAAEESRTGAISRDVVHWWAEYAERFFAPFENDNVVAVVSSCAMADVDHSDIRSVLKDAIVLTGLDPTAFGDAHDIDLDHFAEILPQRIITAIVYAGSKPSSKLTSQAQLAQLAKFQAQLSGRVAALSPLQARSQVAAWCGAEADLASPRF